MTARGCIACIGGFPSLMLPKTRLTIAAPPYPSPDCHARDFTTSYIELRGFSVRVGRLEAKRRICRLGHTLAIRK